MAKRLTIQRQSFRCALDRRCDWIRHTPFESDDLFVWKEFPHKQKARSKRCALFGELTRFLLCGCRLKHWQDRHMLHIRCSDPFKVRTNAAQFGVNESVNEMQTTIEPRKHFVLDLVMHCQSNFGA